MSKSNTFENDYMQLVFNNVAIAGLGDATGIRGSAVAGDLVISLHTADPGEAGTQLTSEAAYTGYARMPLARTAANFIVTDNAVRLAANLEFGACTASPGAPLTHFAIGTAASGAGKVLYKGTLTPTVTMAVGVVPRLTTAPNLVTED